MFEIVADNGRIKLSNFTIQGTLPSSIATAAIGSDGDRGSISGATFSDLEIRDVGVGISVTSPRVGHCSFITITGNYLDNIQDVIKPDGATSGSGYGIHTENCWHVRIANNVIRNADRHAIYQALGNGLTGGSGVLIEHNLILDHATTPSLDRWYFIALVVARSKDVVVADNLIVTPAGIAMSIEEAEPDFEKAPDAITNVQFLNNTVVGAGGADMYLMAGGNFVFAGNRFAHWGSSGMSNVPRVTRDGNGNSGRLVDIAAFPGAERLVTSAQPAVTYVMQQGTLFAFTTSYAPDALPQPGDWPRSRMPGTTWPALTWPARQPSGYLTRCSSTTGENQWVHIPCPR